MKLTNLNIYNMTHDFIIELECYDGGYSAFCEVPGLRIITEADTDQECIKNVTSIFKDHLKHDGQTIDCLVNKKDFNFKITYKL